MEPTIRAAYDAQRDFGSKPFRSGCYAPFVSLYFNSLGEVLACCKNTTYVLGNVAEQRLKEIWSGRKITGLRTALSDYRFDLGCEFCEWQIAGGAYEDSFATGFEQFPVESADPEWPQVIEFSGSNNCNFECVMCSGEFSSLIRSRREGLPPLAKVYSDQFFEDLRSFLPHLRSAKFLGGEPFLAPECFRIWDMILEDGLTIPCHVTTNASQYNAKVERILEALPISLSISVDGATKQTVEKIRVNCNYDEYFRNIQRFREYTKRRGTYMGISHCLMRENWHEFGDVLLLGESLGCNVFVNTVLAPDECSLFTLPPAELDRIVDEMEKQGSALDGKLPINQQVWASQLANLRANARGRHTGTLTQIQNSIWNAQPDDRLSLSYSVNKGWELAGEGRWREALEEALATKETNPYYYDAVVLCGHIRLSSGDLEQAESDLNRAIQLSRRPYHALTVRAWLRVEQKRFEEGIADALRARELSEGMIAQDAEVCWVLGYLYAHTGNASAARNAMDRLLEYKPEDVEVRASRAEVFEFAGEYANALREVEIALTMDSRNANAIQIRSRLQASAL